MPRRSTDVMKKGWNYMLDVLERPSDVPFLTYAVMAHKAHLGEVLKLRRVQRWMEEAGVKVVIDVGANAGQFASAVRSIFPEVFIYSFEPLPDQCAKLRERVERRGKFKAFCMALGEKAGETPFWQSAFSKSSSPLPMTQLHKEAFPWSAENASVTVRMNTLDNIASELMFMPKTLLKIDVQGYEMNVLRGARATLGQIDYVLVETSFRPLYTGQASFHDVYQYLIGRGFEYAGSPEQLHSPLDGTILQEDALFVRGRE